MRILIKNNRGISIVELVIVMIIMILLVAFAVYSGIGSVEKAEATELYEEMYCIKAQLNNIYMAKVMNDADDEWYLDYTSEDAGNGWYRLNSGDKVIGKKYGVESFRRNYLVNFEEDDVVLETPVKVLGSSLRSYDSVRALVESDKI